MDSDKTSEAKILTGWNVVSTQSYSLSLEVASPRSIRNAGHSPIVLTHPLTDPAHRIPRSVISPGLLSVIKATASLARVRPGLGLE